MDRPSLPEPAPLLVACLCAEWCGTCRDYRTVMRQVLGAHPDGELRPVWVDIEDEDLVVGDTEIDNFPTLLLARGDELLFYGTLTPHAQTLERLLQAALVGDLRPVTVDSDLQGLLRRVQRHVDSGGR